MALATDNRHYPIVDENANPSESVTEAIMKSRYATLMIDRDIAQVLEGLNGKAPAEHHHQIPDIEGLSLALENKMPSDRVFKLDDLSDVDGANDAQTGYVLVKTPSGLWVAQAASSALGSHQHAITDIQGLSQALTDRQLISQKGAAGGYPGLDASAKVPVAQLPALTTTATVGAALAGANGVATPADGDRFAGVLAGASTAFWTTWGNIKAALKAYLDPLFVARNGGDLFSLHANWSLNGLFVYNADKSQVYNVWTQYRYGVPTVAATGGTVPVRDSSGDITARLFRTEYQDQGTPTIYLVGLNAIGSGADNYLRPFNVAHLDYKFAQSGHIRNVIEDRAIARRNEAVTASRMAGAVQVLMNMGQDGQGSAIENSAYVITGMNKTEPWRVTITSRQPQLYIANVGWFAAFPF
ncbi:hypothetical protein [Phyllobacterium myrsinacearum]|uniref:Phage tail protein n=1 Tax=Phyllobacterium myrsinacearum TaxID=28101 RepID=A0A839EHX6_9HYPH|nr:hypothetical protein [Phyllobacterium myrsinacearum]MBA8877875.1 hypothetical protein [Phyllobacterium myrsinacearum]